MARRVELGAAALSSVAALLWLVYVIHLVQALGGAIGVTGQPFFNLNMGVIALLCVLTAALILGLSLGTYLHIVHGRQIGVLVLWCCAGLLIADLAAYDFAGWGMVPVTPSGLVSPAIWTGTNIPTILPILEVLTISFAVVAVLASVAPTAARAIPDDQRYAPGRYPVQGH